MSDEESADVGGAGAPMTSQKNRRKATPLQLRRWRRQVVEALAGIEPRPTVTVVTVSALLAALPEVGDPPEVREGEE